MQSWVILAFSLFVSLTAVGSSSASNAVLLETEYFVQAVDSYNNEKDDSVKKEKIESVLKNISQNSDFKYKNYWNAVFMTFDCELKDKNRLIPFCIIAELSEIKKQLNQSYQDYPNYYHYAPARTLGIMYLKMPSIVGGSLKKSLNYLQEAYKGDKSYEENKIWLKKVYEEMNKPEDFDQFIQEVN